MPEVLTVREETVLLSLLMRFVETCEPVGSRVLAEENPEGLSSASIRATLGRLEEKGYLSHPHTSAGRVPTDDAYRFFAGKAAELPAPPLDGEPVQIERMASEGSLNGVVRSASEILSRSTRVLGFAATPPLDDLRLRECELVGLSRDRVLLVVVSQGGQVHECTLHTPRPCDHDALRLFSNLLNDSFRGLTFSEIRQRLRRELASQGCALLEGITAALRHSGEGEIQASAAEGSRDAGPAAEALRLVAPYFLGEPGGRLLFYEGVDRLVTAPALRGDPDALGALLESLQTRGRLLELLDAFAREGVVLRVVLGDQWPDAGTRGLSMVLAPFEAGPEGRGLVGVIGPKPMRYDRTVPIVRSVARCVALAGARL